MNDPVPEPVRTYYWLITASWHGREPCTASGTIDAYTDDTYQSLADRALVRYANTANAGSDMAVILFHLVPNDLT